jgi:hypothetical protein
LEDAIIALRPMKQNLPFAIPDSTRALDVTNPLGTTGQFTNINPSTGTPMTVVNQLTNFGWEYVWHCHLLGHEENDMMRPIVFKVQPVNVPVLSGAVTQTPLAAVLNWTYTNNPSNLATGFQIIRTQGATTLTLATLTDVALRTFTDTTVAPTTTYSYKVIAFNADSVSLPSNIVTLTTPAPAVPLLAPQNLQAPAALLGTTALTLVWNGVTGATQYIVQISTNGGVTWVNKAVVATTTFRVTDLTTLTEYRFRVIASNGVPALQSPPSGVLSVTTR